MKRSYIDRRNDIWNIVETPQKRQRIGEQQVQNATTLGALDGDQCVQNVSLQALATAELIPSSAVSDLDGRHPVNGPGNEQPPMVFFPNAQNLMIRNATMVDKSTTMVAGSTVMDKLRLHIDSHAAIDSSARVPAPTCHPKTRLEIRKRLTAQLHDINKTWRMLWLFGAAGTGKSAVGQSFATDCDERGELGAAFFFSRPNGRNRYNTVVPTLAYQLATHSPPYYSALSSKIDRDHDIFNKKPPVQFKKLIIEPLLQIRSQITTTFLMLLDGVDECGANMENVYEREEEQRELVKMVAEAVRDYPSLPLFWLLCSRPEEHLQVAYTDANPVCRREDLVIDAKCREEVDIVLREGFVNIAKDRRVVVPEPGRWPSQNEFNIVEQAVAGLHVFGAAILKDIRHSASPVRQLKSLIPFLKRIAGSGYPGSIKVMDLFYARILGEIPEDELPLTLRIIGTLITMPDPEELPTHAFCNFIRLDPNDFSSALRMVHSIINIPPPERAHKDALHLYHASLSDFLTSVSRSRNFYIDKQKVLVDLIKTCFSWHTSHYHYFHRTPARPLVYWKNVSHDHGPLPRAKFTWIPPTNSHNAISDAICNYVELRSFELFEMIPDHRDEELLSVIYDLDLRYISDPGGGEVQRFLNWVHKWDSPSGFIRTGPKNDSDRLLLTTLEALLKEPPTPGQFPLDWYNRPRHARFCEYVLFGRGLLSIVICFVQANNAYQFLGLNSENAADKNVISYYQKLLRGIDWYPED